jgi:hypothetical protein
MGRVVASVLHAAQRVEAVRRWTAETLAAYGAVVDAGTELTLAIEQRLSTAAAGAAAGGATRGGADGRTTPASVTAAASER